MYTCIKKCLKILQQLQIILNSSNFSYQNFYYKNCYQFSFNQLQISYQFQIIFLLTLTSIFFQTLNFSNDFQYSTLLMKIFLLYLVIISMVMKLIRDFSFGKLLVAIHDENLISLAYMVRKKMIFLFCFEVFILVSVILRFFIFIIFTSMLGLAVVLCFPLLNKLILLIKLMLMILIYFLYCCF